MGHSTIWERSKDRTSDGNFFGRKIGLIGRLFGCNHRDLSRPFTREKVSYRSCLGCGARKKFDAESLVTYGSFYYPPETAGRN